MKEQYFILGLALLLLPWAVVASVDFSDCGSKDGKVSSVDVVGCDSDSTCILHRGANSTITINFTPEKESKSVTSIVHGVIQGLPVPFDFPYPDACKYGGLNCPLSANTNYVYTATLPIKKIYPRIHVQVKWQLKNEEEDDIICVKIPVQIK